MDFLALQRCLNRARAAVRNGNIITADSHMRHALSIANSLKSATARRVIFRIRNKMRPHVSRELDYIAAQIVAGKFN